ncbi:MAG: superinfection immunity protein [Ruminococcaceae bacterium]|nr:superinfection immunity protein [Oscillospiraceae bacterium]
MPQEMRGLVIVALIFLGFPVYFLPAYIAGKREHPQRRKLLLWNVFTAWTVIGWMVVMILAARGSGAEAIATDMQKETTEAETTK